MIRTAVVAAVLVLSATSWFAHSCGRVEAAPPGQPTDWQRFYYYPYVYYPHNFQQYPESYDHLYYRYPVQKQIPVYNADWHNFYLMPRPYHSGYHYALDVF
jgi:hypothetical protein